MDIDKLDRFTRSYLETALWSTNDESDDSGGEPLDQNYSIDDFSEEAIAQAMTECEDFQNQCGDLWPDDKQAGHNFWLTRNHYGAGFWDGDYPEHGETLTDISNSFAPIDLYVGDDGLLYFG